MLLSIDFDGAYAAITGPVCSVNEPMLLDMLTMRGESARLSSGSIAFVTRTTPRTFVSRTVRTTSRSSVTGSCAPPSVRPEMPALLTSTSSRPAVRSIASAAAATLSSEVTSRATPNASTPAVRSRATASSRLASSRAPTATVKPSAPRPWAMARPIPLFAPVTSAVFVSFVVFTRSMLGVRVIVVQDRFGTP